MVVIAKEITHYCDLLYSDNEDANVKLQVRSFLDTCSSKESQTT